MGDIIATIIVVLIFGSIIIHLIKNYLKNGQMCSCKSCPASKLITKEGKIDLLKAVEKMKEDDINGTQ